MRRQNTPSTAAPPSRESGRDERLDCWKEIAQYLRRSLRTVQRWERVAALPVRRVGSGQSAVYAFRAELDAWWRKQPPHLTGEADGDQPPGPAPQLGPDAARHGEGSPTLPYGTMRVRPFLSQSIDINPESPAAHADLAVYFFTLVVMGLVRPTDGMPAARAAAERAIDLAPSMPRAHAVTALVAGLYEHDWAEAARRFGRALQANSEPWARFAYATWYLSPLGRHHEALSEVRHASVDDPLYLLGRVQVAMELCSIGQAQEGMHELEMILAIDPRFGPALGLLGRECILRGREDDAMTLAERTYAATPQHPNGVGFLAGMLQRTGNGERSRQLLDSFGRETPWALPRARAEFELAFANVDAAVGSMAGAIECRDPGIWLLLHGSSGRLIRATRQWPLLAGRMHLPVD
jgi:Tfp pilus assembly protein PilF